MLFRVVVVDSKPIPGTPRAEKTVHGKQSIKGYQNTHSLTQTLTQGENLAWPSWHGFETRVLGGKSRRRKENMRKLPVPTVSLGIK